MRTSNRHRHRPHGTPQPRERHKLRLRWATAGYSPHPQGARGSPMNSRSFKSWNPSAYFSSASSEVKVLGAFFCNFATSSLRLVSRSRARSATRPRTKSCGFEASEPIPFPGADSIFSRHCGAISGRLRFVVGPSRAAQFLRDQIDPLEGPRGAGGRASSRAKRSDRDRGVSNCGLVWIPVRHVANCDCFSRGARIGAGPTVDAQRRRRLGASDTRVPAMSSDQRKPYHSF